MQDILLIDKPKGFSSFDVIRELRRRLGIRKMGHAGTLDPMATGLLIIGIGKGTRRLREFIGLAKTYRMSVLLGKRTRTGDIEGNVIEERPVGRMTRERIEETLGGMVGDIELPVPTYSALKYRGRPYYYYARRGLTIPAKRRITRIHRIKLCGIKQRAGQPLLDVELEAGAGTYARSVAEEIGSRLGLPSTLAGLRRTKIGAISISQATRLEAIRPVLPPLPKH